MTPTATGVPFFLVRRAAPGGFVETPFDDGRGSVLAGGRYSYTGLLVPLFAKDTRIGYWDCQARASYDLSAREKVSVFAFGSNDNLEQRDNATGNFRRTFATEFHRVDVRYDRTLGSTGKLRLAATLGYDTFRDDTSEVSDALVGLRAVAEGDIVRGAKLRGGADAELHSYGLAHPPATLFALDETTLYATNVLYPPHNDATFGAYADVVLRVSPRLLAIGIEPILTASRGCGRRQADRGIGACGRIRPPRFSTACEKIVNRRRCASRSRSFIAAKSAAAAALVCGSVLPVPKECVVDDEANRHDNHEGEPADEDADRNVPENDDRARERHGISSSLTSSLQRRSVCSFESHATSWPLACEPGHCNALHARRRGTIAPRP